MRVIFPLLAFCLFSLSLSAQFALKAATPEVPSSLQEYLSAGPVASAAIPKVYQRNIGVIVGLQKGRYTFIELGGEAHFRKITLRKPRITGVTVNMEYNFRKNVIGYKAGLWMKKGRVNFTYGGNIAYFTDFEGNHKYGLGPMIGFRLLGFHLVNGLNFLAGDREVEGPNVLYLSLRYYFPLDNKFTWDRKGNHRKNDRERDRRGEERRKRDRDEAEDQKPNIFDRIKEKIRKKED